MFRTLSQFFACLTLLASPSPADHLTAQAHIGPNDSEVTLQLYLFDAREESFVVIDQGRPAMQSYQNLEAAMKAHKCLAGCNGGPFDSEGIPLGLVIADGKSSGTARAGEQRGSGILYLENEQPRLQRIAPFLARKSPQPKQLIQSGPFLIENGKATPELDQRRISRRTFVFTDGKHRWGIGTSPATTLHKLALALAKPDTFKSFNLASALALDGGLSSGLWIKRQLGPLYLKEIRTLRNFLGVVKR